MAKIEAFQDVKEKPVEISSPIPTESPEVTIDRPPLKEDIVEKPVEPVQSIPQEGIDNAPDRPVFRESVEMNPPERVDGTSPQAQETKDIPLSPTTFRANIPQKPLEDSPSKIRGEVIQNTQEVRGNVFRNNVPPSTLERGFT